MECAYALAQLTEVSGGACNTRTESARALFGTSKNAYAYGLSRARGFGIKKRTTRGNMAPGDRTKN